MDPDQNTTRPQIDVCLSPDLINNFNLEGTIAVVVDILRASSCITAGISNQIDHIIPFEHLEECLKMKPKGYWIAGERDGAKVDGFDFGNSPYSYLDPCLKGEKVAVTTTNGTVAIAKSREADIIVIGSFLNLSRLTEYLLDQSKPINVICAGWKGKVNLEDTLFAGALVHKLMPHYTPACDAPMVAEAAWLNAKNNLMEAMNGSSHVRRLRRLNIERDIEFCLTPDQFDVIPVCENGRIVSLP